MSLGRSILRPRPRRHNFYNRSNLFIGHVVVDIAIWVGCRWFNRDRFLLGFFTTEYIINITNQNFTWAVSAIAGGDYAPLFHNIH